MEGTDRAAQGGLPGTSGCGTAKLNRPFATVTTSCPGESHQTVPLVAGVSTLRIAVRYEPSNEVTGGAGGGSLRMGPIGPAQPPRIAARATICGLTKRWLIVRCSPDQPSPQPSAIA